MTKTRVDLKTRRDKPTVRRTAAKNKRAWKFGVLKIQEQVKWKKEAGRLDSKTRVCLDNGDPILRKNPKGELETEPSQEAKAEAKQPLRAVQRKGRPVMKKPKEVEAEAKALVLSEGGDPQNERLVLSRFIIQFGKYRGKHFKWLLENDLGWTIYLVGSHLNQLDEGKKQDGPLMANKVSFVEYVNAYPEVEREIESWRSRQKVQDGDVLLGFGEHRSETLRSLYESKDPEKIRYVAYLRDMSTKCSSGSKMETAVKYILQRDKKPASASTRASSLKRKRKTTAKSSKRGSSGTAAASASTRASSLKRKRKTTAKSSKRGSSGTAAASASTRASSLKRKRKTTAKSSKRGSSGTAAASAASTGGDTSGEEDKHFVDKHRSELIKRVRFVSSLLDVFLQERFITQEGYDEIMAESTTRKKMMAIYSGPLQSCTACKDIFIEWLEEDNPHVIAELKKKKK